MKKYMVVPLFALAVAMAGCGGQPEHKNTPPEAVNKHQKEKHYTCTMHPEVISNKPGVCPKCGMDLVEKDEK